MRALMLEVYERLSPASNRVMPGMSAKPRSWLSVNVTRVCTWIASASDRSSNWMAWLGLFISIFSLSKLCSLAIARARFSGLHKI